jgi:hypothetical protein
LLHSNDVKINHEIQSPELLQPWRCLWRGSLQMMRTTPLRRITLQFRQIHFTEGNTFMFATPQNRVFGKAAVFPVPSRGTCSSKSKPLLFAGQIWVSRQSKKLRLETAKTNAKPARPWGCVAFTPKKDRLCLFFFAV